MSKHTRVSTHTKGGGFDAGTVAMLPVFDVPCAAMIRGHTGPWPCWEPALPAPQATEPVWTPGVGTRLAF